MKTKAVLLATAASIATLMTAGAADAAHYKGWYVGLEAGANWVQDWDFTSSTITHNHEFSANFDAGWAVLGTVGYDFGHWRVEGELGYRDNDIDVYGTGGGGFGAGPDAGLEEISLMANVLYDIALTSKLALSVGAGVGADHVDVDFAAIPGSDFDDWQFAYQGIVGLSYAIGSRTDLTLNYRYLHVEAPELDIGPFNNHIFTDSDDVEKHTVTVGLRYDLWADEVPVEVAPPPPPPPPPPPVESFIVFFGFNKCNITAEADAVLSEAAAAAKAKGAAAIKIVGHTDTVGSHKYNQKLSECRAGAAKSSLVSKGVPEGAISTTGAGETQLLVQTGDGVKEPQNRRATIDLD